MARFSILLGGPLAATDRLRAQVGGTRAIAADSGIAHAALLGLAVELWVGDFDSSGPELLAAHHDVPREIFPVEKDRTDGDIAIAAALARGADEVILVGSMGGRADQVLGHFALALRHARRGLRVMLTSGTEEAWPLIAGASLTVDLPAGATTSIIPLDDLRGLTTSGVRWPLTAADVELGSTWTLSNVAQGGEAQFRLASGHAIVIAGVAS